MTISDPNTSRVEFNPVAGTTDLAFPFKIFTADDILLYKNGSVFSDYIIQGIDNDAGGLVILSIPSEEGDFFILIKNLGFTRDFYYKFANSFLTKSINRSFELSRSTEQQVRDSINELGLSYTEETFFGNTNFQTIPKLPASNMWKSNSAGTLLEAFSFDSSFRVNALRKELAENTSTTLDGSKLVGYYSSNNGSTTLLNELNFLSPPVTDAVNAYRNSVDSTKQVKYDASKINTDVTSTINIIDMNEVIGIPPFYNTGFSFDELASNELRVHPGIARKGFGEEIFHLKVIFAKKINQNWVLGNGLGGFPSTLTLSANTSYHIFVLINSSGEAELGYDTDINATNLLIDTTPSGYDKFFRVGSFRTQDGSTDISPFRLQIFGEERRMDFKALNMIGLPTMSPATTVYVFTLPIGVKVEAIFNIVTIGTFVNSTEFHDGDYSGITVNPNASTITKTNPLIHGNSNINTNIVSSLNGTIASQSLFVSAVGAGSIMHCLGYFDNLNVS